MKIIIPFLLATSFSVAAAENTTLSVGVEKKANFDVEVENSSLLEADPEGLQKEIKTRMDNDMFPMTTKQAAVYDESKISYKKKFYKIGDTIFKVALSPAGLPIIVKADIDNEGIRKLALSADADIKNSLKGGVLTTQVTSETSHGYDEVMMMKMLAAELKLNLTFKKNGNEVQVGLGGTLMGNKDDASSSRIGCGVNPDDMAVWMRSPKVIAGKMSVTAAYKRDLNDRMAAFLQISGDFLKAKKVYSKDPVMGAGYGMGLIADSRLTSNKLNLRVGCDIKKAGTILYIDVGATSVADTKVYDQARKMTFENKVVEPHVGVGVKKDFSFGNTKDAKSK